MKKYLIFVIILSINLYFKSDGYAQELPDIKLYPVQKCTLCPNCSINQKDALQFALCFRNLENAPVNKMVTVRAESDLGLRGQTNSYANTSDNDCEAVTILGVEITERDYGQQHNFEIEVNHNNRIEELDKNNNKTTVTVNIPRIRPNTHINLDCN